MLRNPGPAILDNEAPRHWSRVIRWTLITLHTKTSTYALTNVTIKYALDIAGKGFKRALAEDAALCKGLNTYQGNVTHKIVADAVGMPFAAYI